MLLEGEGHEGGGGRGREQGEGAGGGGRDIVVGGCWGSGRSRWGGVGWCRVGMMLTHGQVGVCWGQGGVRAAHLPLSRAAHLSLLAVGSVR